MVSGSRIILSSLLLVSACAPRDEAGKMFESLAPEYTGVTFANTLAEDATFNILNYLYYYNGGGVAVGDVDGDGLLDLYFTSNEGPNKLYVNRGDMRFEDVTDQAGVTGAADWTTGVTMADVDGDGLIDIYVSVLGGYLDRRGRNELFINNGDGTFSERAEEYGLDFEGYSTHAVFFDFDRDGDLDVYLLNHSTHYEGTYVRADLRETLHDRAGDRLLRNDGDVFVDVSAEAGIHSGVAGYGLSVTVSDFNVDGWPDIYVANDFHENDFLYFNNGDGTFTESITGSMAHTSRFSMGVDAADINNDGLPDVAVLDMLPQREEILKTSDGPESYDLYNLKLHLGYHHQVTRNTLQLNVDGQRFSDVAYLAGVHASDWSWAPLLADFDNDGHRDLFITNGIFRRPNDLDYINYISNDAIQASLAQGITEENLTLLERMPQVRIANYLFRNNGDLTFANVAGDWGVGDASYSNGAVYADLDNDGDLDLVVNNVNGLAAIYQNQARQITGNNFLTVVLVGDGKNTHGIGARVLLAGEDFQLVAEQMPVRGFQSAVDPRLHFGLGVRSLIDSVLVTWPDGRYQVVHEVAANETIVLRQSDAAGTYSHSPLTPGETLFSDVTASVGLPYRHEENVFVDFNRERLMPHKISTEGPALAVADVNGDGLDDFYVGGAKWKSGMMFVQQPDGTFLPDDEDLWASDSLYEDVDAAFFDADGDGYPDLYVVSAGNEFWGEAEALRDRLYVNDGNGGFRRDTTALPAIFAHGSTVIPGDFDGDGDIDLFVGSRVVPYKYSVTPPSYLLENDGTGRFADVTELRAPDLLDAGMVTDAAWVDYDADGQLDLILVGEWMPITILAQENGRFHDRTSEAGLQQTNGWWNSLTAADLDGDGHMDLVVGNLGLNSKLKARPDEPARLYVKDFDGNGSLDQILTFYKGGISYPFAGRDQLIQQIEPLRKKFVAYTHFGASQVQDIFTRAEIADADVKEAYTFATSYALNNGDGAFSVRQMPLEAQIAPVRAAVAGDFDGDGHQDILVGGNFYGVGPARGRYDASFGLLLLGDGRGGLAPVEPRKSNLFIEGEVRAIRPLRRADGSTVLLVARNNDALQILRLDGHPVDPSPAIAIR